MPLTGEAKKEYQREYMRKRRMLNKNKEGDAIMLDLETEEEKLRQEKARLEEALKIALEKRERREAELAIKRRELALKPGGEEELKKLAYAAFEAQELAKAHEEALRQVEERLQQINEQKQALAKTEEQKRLEAELRKLAQQRLALAKEIEEAAGALVGKVKAYLDLCTPISALARQVGVNTPDAYVRKSALFSFLCRTFGSIFPDMPPAAYKSGLVESEKAVMGDFLEGGE